MPGAGTSGNGPDPDTDKGGNMLGLIAVTGAAATLLWVIAAVLVIAGIVTAVRGGVAAGVVMIIVGLLIGPGGVSLFD